MVALDRGNFGQESDVNRACSAFGLDTVNYRAFPENGPVPPSPTAPLPLPAAPSLSVAAPSPAVAAAPVSPVPLEATVLPAAPIQAAPIQAAPLQAPAAPMPAMAQQQPVDFRPANAAQSGLAAAPVFPIPQAVPTPQWAAPPPDFAPGFAASPYPAPGYNPAAPQVHLGYVPQPAMPPANFGYQPRMVPPAAPPMPAPAAGPSFSLLAQAVPAANPASQRPMGAFAMASVSLLPISPGWQGGAMPQAAAPVAAPAQGPARPEMFGTAFAAAYNATFGNGRPAMPGSPALYPQS
jgi:hypothetical protein